METSKIKPKQRRVNTSGSKQSFDLNAWFEKISFSSTQQQAFLEDLATLVSDGVPASRAIDVISRIEEGAKKRVALNIAAKISEGRGIADGMVGWFNASTIELVRAGEQGGTLAENIRAAANALSSKAGNISSLITSTLYPLIVIIAGCCVIIYLNKTIFPQFASIKPIDEWPDIGKTLVSFSNFIQLWWWLIIAIIIGSVVGINMMLNNLVGKWRTVIDALYGLSTYRQIESARFMETLGLLIANGVVFKKAVKIMEHQASPYLAWHLKMMEIRLGKGSSNIGDILDTGLISFANIQRLKAIADAKGFEHALIRLGQQASIQATATIRRLGKILGGVLLFLGASLAIFMILGIYSVGSSLAS